MALHVNDAPRRMASGVFPPIVNGTVETMRAVEAVLAATRSVGSRIFDYAQLHLHAARIALEPGTRDWVSDMRDADYDVLREDQVQRVDLMRLIEKNESDLG